MSLPVNPEHPLPHELVAREYVPALGALVGASLARVDAVSLLLDESELTLDVDDAERAERTWEAVRDDFSPSADPPTTADDRAWYRAPLPDAAEALRALVDLTDGHVGRHFVQTLVLVRDEAAVLRAVPHHSRAAVDASLLERGNGALADRYACLVPWAEGVCWESADRRFAVEGGSLCRETLDGRRGTCWGLANLRYVDRGPDLLRLTWRPPAWPDGPLGRVLSATVGRLGEPPQSLPVPDEETCDAVATRLERFLAVYEPTTRASG
ncbi:hypothetical protein [Halomarina ordinaria]|uniref:DUF3445 domain-containing protein n=1 Tax=Halomarina ordinaria TaxID=3033939 RepID=A0ABD5U4B3_9EURY|nr:hypothetical protein [Halomarina sp. PSRA2]